eukprot:gene3008-3466_t
MEGGRIKDAQITALNWLYQSQDFNLYYKPKYARLNNKRQGGGGWCSENREKFSGPFIEIDLLRDTKLTSLASQGRGIGYEYMDEYGITYKRDGDTKYREYKERGRWHIFTANNDTWTIVRNQLKHPIIARRIRIIPQGDHFTIYCGRFELYGCEWKKQKDGLISYQLPFANDMQGVKTTDNVYDGSTSQLLSYKASGLGKLTDDDYGTPQLGDSLSSKWIAYKRRAQFSPFFQFDFKSKRRFSAIKFHMLNKGSSIKVFTQVQVLFSTDGKLFGNEAKYLTTAAERMSLAAFVITVPINRIIAKNIKCVFAQPKDWMLFSEVDFISESPDAPLPTRPAPVTKKPVIVIKTTEMQTESTTRPRTQPPTPKPTPRLIFSLPISIKSDDDLNKILPKPKSKLPNEVDVTESTENESERTNLLSPNSQNQGKGSLSFPIIIAIVLGAIVLSSVVAVFLFRKVRKMGKKKQRPNSDERLVSASTRNNTTPEFSELLPSDKHVPPQQANGVVVANGRNGNVGAPNEVSTKLIMDSGYTSHGSGGSHKNPSLINNKTTSYIV